MHKLVALLGFGVGARSRMTAEPFCRLVTETDGGSGKCLGISGGHLVI